MNVEFSLQTEILRVVRESATAPGMGEIVALVRQTPAGAGRPARIKAEVLALVATERLELGSDFRLRVPVKIDFYSEQSLPAAVYANDAVIPPPKERTPKAIRRLIDQAFRAGVREGRRRQYRQIRRAADRENDGWVPSWLTAEDPYP